VGGVAVAAFRPTGARRDREGSGGDALRGRITDEGGVPDASGPRTTTDGSR